MKVKTSELTGHALDWAVAKCEPVETSVYAGRVWLLWFETFGYLSPMGTDSTEYAPSTDWAQGGPIIERELIDLVWHACGNPEWVAYPNHGENDEFVQSGPTPLIAAMRAYVESRLGDEVNVPEELMA